MPTQKEIRETFEDIESYELFYETDRYCCGQRNLDELQSMYEKLLPPNVLEMRRERLRRMSAA